jgi:hypothetical protein
MENVILSDKQLQDALVAKYGNPVAAKNKEAYIELIAGALEVAIVTQARHLLRILKEPCTKHPKMLPIKKDCALCALHCPEHRWDCPECMAEIEKEINQ